MKKNALSVMLTAATLGMVAFTSCSNDEEVFDSYAAAQDDIISFTAGVNHQSRHMGDVTTDNLNSFYVTAFLRDPDYNPNKPTESPDANNYFI